ncbi:hypothetical protein D1007_53673 [Hordeum vulgare]|nr:hypothetical protein D1007_53673 [Hordeum vulgare]
MAMSKLALVILVATFLAGSGTPTNGDCEYQLKVKTGDWPGDGMDEAFVVFWLFRDSQGGGGPMVSHEEDAAGVKFDRGRTDEFSFTDPKCIRPCRLVLSLDTYGSSGEGEEWHCQSVDVTVSGDISYSKSFHVNQYVESGRPIEIDECDDAAAA